MPVDLERGRKGAHLGERIPSDGRRGAWENRRPMASPLGERPDPATPPVILGDVASAAGLGCSVSRKTRAIPWTGHAEVFAEQRAAAAVLPAATP